MSTATPGYATNAQMKQAARIRAAARRGTFITEIAIAEGLGLRLVSDMLDCRTIAAAAKLLAEYITECKDKNTVMNT